MTELKPCPFCGRKAGVSELTYPIKHYVVICSNEKCYAQMGDFMSKEDAIEMWNTRPNPWHTGTPKEKGLYVVLTKVSMEGVSSSEGTYILDYWDGYCFQYLKRKAMVYALTEPDTYGWVAWMPITPYEEKENGHTD